MFKCLLIRGALPDCSFIKWQPLFPFPLPGFIFLYCTGFPGGSDGKESACNVGDLGSIPGSGRIPWRREWQPTPVFLPGGFHGQRRLVGYSPWGCKESDLTERLTLSLPSKATSSQPSFSSCDLLKVMVFEIHFAFSFIVQV